MEKDIFDILDVSLREDTYSSLIVEVLRNSPPILKGVVRELIGKELTFNGKDCVAFRKQIRKKKDRPDIVIKGNHGQVEHWIVIESKIKSGEGERQCERYREIIENKEMQSFNYDLFYLTLTKSEPEDKVCWKAITHKYLADLISKFDVDHVLKNYSKLGFLWNAYIERLNHYENISYPSMDTPIIEWLNQESKHFITADDRCDKLAKVLISDAWKRMGCIYGRTGSQVLIKIWKPSWQGLYFKKEENIPLENCPWIHYELKYSYPCYPGKIDCLLHCETNPYKTKNEIRDLGDGANNYLLFSELFTTLLHQGIAGSKRWKRLNYPLEKAKFSYPINEKTKIGEFSQYLETEFKECCPIVTSSMRMAAKECKLPWWKDVQEI
jgi:hypothetical protein